jgi:hypothetical protein
MKFQLKTVFESLDDAIAYLNGDVAAEINRLESVEGEKGKLISKRDELLNELKTTKTKYEKFKTHEDVDIDELIAFKEQHSGDETAIEKRYQTAYSKDKKAFDARLAAIEKEREVEKQQAEKEREQRAAAQLKAEVLSEFSKGQHKIRNIEQFWKLFGDGAVQQDPDNGALFVEIDYKKLSLSDYVAHLSQDTENQHHFGPSGHTGSGGAQGMATSGKQKAWGQMTLTEKTVMLKNNPDGAKKLAGEAGVALNL